MVLWGFRNMSEPTNLSSFWFGKCQLRMSLRLSQIVSSCFIYLSKKKQWPYSIAKETSMIFHTSEKKLSVLGVLTPLGMEFPHDFPLSVWVGITECLHPCHGGVLEFRNPKLTVPKLILSTSNSNLSQQKKVGKAWENQDTLRFGSE